METISRLDDPRAIMQAAVRTVGEAVGADRAGYSEVSDDDATMTFRVGWTNGGPLQLLTGSIPIESAGDMALSVLRRGITLVIEDGQPGAAATPPAWRTMGTRASVSAPLAREGRYVASLWVHQATPRRWTPAEIELIEDVAARTWDAVKRARAEEELRRLNAGLQAQVEAQTRELRERESLWRSLFESMQEGMLLARILRDDQGRAFDWEYLEVNGPWEALCRMSRREVLGRRLLDVFPHVGKDLLQAIMRVADTGEPFTFQRLFIGTDQWYEGHIFRVDQDRVGLIFLDITEQKRAGDALKASEAKLAEERSRLAALIEHLPIGVCFLDTAGTIQLSNPAYRRFNSSDLAPYLQPDAEARWMALDERGEQVPRSQFVGPRALAGETTLGMEFLVRLDDGQTAWTRISGVPLRKGEGEIAGALVVIDDIDELKRAQAELENLNHTLEDRVARRTAELETAQDALRHAQKMEALGQLTGGIAHDFNNLLAGISGSLELVDKRIAQGRLGEVGRFIEAAQGASKRAAALTHRLLAFSRRQTLTAAPTAIDGLIRGMEDLIRRAIGPRVEMEVIVAPDLWPTLIDPHQLENALLNLCINATHAMPDGGRLTVHCVNFRLETAEAGRRDLVPGDYVALCVIDTGTGMSPDIAARAFDPFFTTKPSGQGTGLGLSMVYGFVRQSGGHVEIESRIGEGTTVRLYLPRHDGPADAAFVEDASPAALRPPRRGVVLVVDDEPSVRMLLREVAEGVGFTVIEAVDGASAMKVIESKTTIDLLITDVGLPGGLNGRQVADAARATRRTLKVLLVTGYAESQVLAPERLEPGMRVLTKPFATAALEACILDMAGVGES